MDVGILHCNSNEGKQNEVKSDNISVYEGQRILKISDSQSWLTAFCKGIISWEFRF